MSALDLLRGQGIQVAIRNGKFRFKPKTAEAAALVREHRPALVAELTGAGTAISAPPTSSTTTSSTSPHAGASLATTTAPSRDLRDDLPTRRHRLIDHAEALGWPLVASWVPPQIPLLGLPAGKLGSLGPRESWESFIARAAVDQLSELERLLTRISAQRRQAEPITPPTPASQPERCVPSPDLELELRREIVELAKRALPAMAPEIIEAMPPMRPEFLIEERDWLRALLERDSRAGDHEHDAHARRHPNE